MHALYVKIESLLSTVECEETRQILAECADELKTLRERVNAISTQAGVDPAPDNNSQCNSLFMMLALFGKHLNGIENDLETMRKLKGFEHCDDYRMAQQEHDHFLEQIKTIARQSAQYAP